MMPHGTTAGLPQAVSECDPAHEAGLSCATFGAQVGWDLGSFQEKPARLSITCNGAFAHPPSPHSDLLQGAMAG